MSIRHASLNPAKVAILDPLALKSLPATVAAHSAMDAFVHAFESYIALNAKPDDGCHQPVRDRVDMRRMSDLLSPTARIWTRD